MDKLIKLLKELIDSGFFGELLIKFENGKVTLVRKTQNIKP